MATRTSPERSSKKKSTSKSKKTSATTEETPYNVTETTQPWVVRAVTRSWAAVATPFGGAVRKMGPDVTIPVEQRAVVYQYYDGGIIGFTAPAIVGILAAGLLAALLAAPKQNDALRLRTTVATELAATMSLLR